MLAATGAYGWWRLHNAGGQNASAPLVLYGNVEIRQADLAFGVEGPIAQILVDEGDRVEAGQTLAVLEQDAFVHAEANAEAMLKSAEARLAELLSGSRPQEIERARANVSAAEAALENAELNLRRANELAKREHAAQQALDSARLTHRTAAALLRQARAELALRLEGSRAEEITQQRAEVAARRATLALQRYRLARSTLKAPNAGIVLTRVREAGAVVNANAPVFTLSVIDPVWIRTYVDEPNLGRVVPGALAQIATDAMPRKLYNGQVGYVSPTAEFTPKSVEAPNLRTALVYRVRIVVQNPDRALRQGMPATISIAAHAGTDP
jgi:HlyD family secretion protein